MGGDSVPIRVAVPLPGPFVWVPGRRGRSSGGGGGGGSNASPHEMLVGLFVVLIIAGWVGLTWCWQQGVGWGVLGSLGYLAWAVLWGVAFRHAAERDPDYPGDAVTTGSRIVWSFGLGVPIVYGNLVAWHIPVLAVALNVASVAGAVMLRRASRQRKAERELAALDAEYAAEEAAIQAEIDAEEAERARFSRAAVPHARRWAPPGCEGRDEQYWRRGQGFRVP